MGLNPKLCKHKVPHHNAQLDLEQTSEHQLCLALLRIPWATSYPPKHQATINIFYKVMSFKVIKK